MKKFTLGLCAAALLSAAAPAALTALTPAPAYAQQTASQDVARFAADLRTLVALAQQYNAAHPRFLADLTLLANQYDPAGAGPTAVAPPTPVAPPAVQPPPQTTTPAPRADNDDREQRREERRQNRREGREERRQRTVFLRDNFSDGDLTRDPAWTAHSGDWIVDPQYGLRVPARQVTVQRELTRQELLQALMTGQRPGGAVTRSQPIDVALIEAPVAIENDFFIRVTLTDHLGQGSTQFIVHQGGDRWNGYRLEIRGGANPEVALMTRGSRGYTELAKAPAPQLAFDPNRAAAEGPPSHDIRWVRRPNGQMRVRIGDETVLEVRNTSFRDPFVGFAIFNSSSDVSFSRVVARSFD